MEKLYYIASNHPTYSHTELVQKSCENGIKLVQLRIKNESHYKILEIASDCINICNQYNAKLIINDYIDVCKTINAHGVHLGQNDANILEARKILGDDVIIGGTANTLDQVEKLIENKANYIGLGPFKFTETKQNLSPVLGLRGYENILSQLKNYPQNFPIYAIGGITLQDISYLLNVGLHGVAISSLISNDFDNVGRINKLL